MKRFLLKMIFAIFLLIISKAISAQAKLVLNGGIINIINDASLVIENPDNTAITSTNSGYIQSEGAGNKVIWKIGAGNGNLYTIPFGNVSNNLPVSFHASSGSQDGYFIFSTYPTSTWKNSDELPPGVTNVNANGADNSAKLIDRFWEINPQEYSTKPTLVDLVFTYGENEFSAPNTITENSLISQRWNNVAMTWSDFIPSSAINTGTNTVLIASIPGNQLFDWWTLVDAGSPLPVALVFFKAIAVNNSVITTWQTSSEINTAKFEVYRSKDGQHFERAGVRTAAGNSNIFLDYKFIDNKPSSGTSYYRLKTIDLDGKYAWSTIETVTIGDNNLAFLYPNPAHDYLTLQVANSIATATPMVFVYDATGSLVYSFKITNATQRINISRLSYGNYQLVIKQKNDICILKFIKN